MKFKRTLTSRASIKKKETYEFDCFTEEEKQKGREYRWDNPLFLYREGCWHCLFRDDKDETLLCIEMLHSFDKFKEIRLDQTLGTDLKDKASK